MVRPSIANNVLTLVNGFSQAKSAFYNTPQNIIIGFYRILCLAEHRCQSG